MPGFGFGQWPRAAGSGVGGVPSNAIRDRATNAIADRNNSIILARA